MPGPIQSIERAAAVLQLLASRTGRLGLGEVATSLGLARGTAHGILRTLELVGFVEHDAPTGKYQLGAALLHLGTSYLDVNELRSRAINWADPLASRSGAAVRLGTLLDRRVLVVHHVFRPDDTLQVLEVGVLLPPHATALGKVLLAFDAHSAAGVVAAGMEAYTRRTVVAARDLHRALLQVREQGWGCEVEEFLPGDAGLAAPIRGPGGLVVGAIGITGPVEHICDTLDQPRTALIGYVRSAARAISRDLGAARW